MEMVPGLSRGFRVESGLGLVGRVEVGQAQCHGEEQGEQLRPGGWGGASGAVSDLPGVCTWCSVQSYWVSLPTDSSAVVTTALYISPPLYPSHLSQTPHLQCQQATLFYKVKNFHNLIFDFFFFFNPTVDCTISEKKDVVHFRLKLTVTLTRHDIITSFWTRMFYLSDQDWLHQQNICTLSAMIHILLCSSLLCQR